MHDQRRGGAQVFRACRENANITTKHLDIVTKVTDNNAMSYTKLFSSIVTSTIWTEDAGTCKVWVTMLALADKNGEVHASIPGLARVSGMTLEETEAALSKFMSPDKYSRTPDDQGRRIEAIDGGWLLLNHAKYRAMASKDEEKESNAKRQAAFRDRAKRNGRVTGSNGLVTPCNAPVTVGRDIAEADTEAKADTKAVVKPSLQQTASPSGLEGDEKEKQFNRFWNAYPKRKGRTNALKAWMKQKLDSKIDEILTALQILRRDPQWLKDGGQYIPHPATWLNSGGWMDEPTQPATKQETDVSDWLIPIIPTFPQETQQAS